MMMSCEGRGAWVLFALLDGVDEVDGVDVVDGESL